LTGVERGLSQGGSETGRSSTVTISTGSEARQGAQIERPEWATYFDELTRRLEHGTDLEASIEIVGDKVVGEEVERLPLLNITYEDGDDEVAIGVGGRGRRFPATLWHYVEKPRLIWVHEHDGLPTAIAFESEDGTLTLLRLYPAR
jgi:hypothetical protein